MASMNTSSGSVDASDSDNNDINTTVYLAFVIVFFTIGLCGNILILLAIRFEPQLQTFGYAFTANAAISDIAVLFLADGFIIAGIATEGAYLKQNPMLCNLSSSFCLAVCICSIWSHAAGSFHSYVRVCHRLRYHRIFNRYVIIVTIIFLWIGSQLVVLPTLVGWGGHVYSSFLGYCLPDYLVSPSYTLFFLTTGIFTPLLISTYSFIKIGYSVFLSRRRITKQVTPHHSESSKPNIVLPPRLNDRDIRLVRSFFFITVYLFSAWFYLAFIMLCGDTKTFSATKVTIALTFAHTHCSVNGVLYAMTHKQFRKAYVDVLCSCYKFCCTQTSNDIVTEIEESEI